VRVEGPRQAAEVDLQQLAHVELVDESVAVLVADQDLLDGLLALGLVDDLELEEVELDLLPPALLGLLGVGRVVVEVGVVEDRLVGGEVGFLLHELVDRGEALVGPLEEAVEDLAREVEVPLSDPVIERGGLGGELRDVPLLEVVLLGVEILQEGLAPLLGDLVVDLGLGHVSTLQELDHHPRRELIDGGRVWSLRPDHRRQRRAQDRRQYERT